VPALIGAGARVHVTDPEGRKEGEELLPGVTWEEDAYAAVESADAVVLLTEWNAFRGLDLARLAGLMKTPQGLTMSQSGGGTPEQGKKLTAVNLRFCAAVCFVCALICFGPRPCP